MTAPVFYLVEDNHSNTKFMVNERVLKDFLGEYEEEQRTSLKIKKIILADWEEI